MCCTARRNQDEFKRDEYSGEAHFAAQPALLDVPGRFGDARTPGCVFVVHNTERLRHHDNLVAGECEFLDGLAEYDLRQAIGVDVRGIKSVDTRIVCDWYMLKASVFTEGPGDSAVRSA